MSLPVPIPSPSIYVQLYNLPYSEQGLYIPGKGDKNGIKSFKAAPGKLLQDGGEAAA